MKRRGAGVIGLMLAVAPVAWADALPPTVTVTAPADGSTILSTGVSFNGTATDTVDGISRVRIYIWDEGRDAYTVSNATAAYNVTNRIWSTAVLASQITPGEYARLWVQAIDGAGNSSAWVLRRVKVAGGAVPDTAPPVVTITGPSAAVDLPAAGGTFQGTATDAVGVTQVRIYIWDEGRGAYTVAAGTAAYTPATGAWTFGIQASHVTPGAFARLWVQARDQAGNFSAWQLRQVKVQSTVVVDTQPPAVTITSPATGAVISASSSSSFSGQATDAGGVAQVKIYVWDEGRGAYTVSNAPATYVPATGAWSFTVAPAHVTGGEYARLWVQASDQAGNFSAWQLRRVLARTPVEQLGPSTARVSGRRLLVSRRQNNGTLATEAPFTIKGVAYSPVDPGELVDTLAAARQHLRESRYAEDFPLMKTLGANVIKTYADLGTDQTATAILNAAHDQGLMVLVSVMDLTPAAVQSVVNACKAHPALLGWIVGNEWNLNLFFSYPSIAQATAAVQSTATLIHQLDPNHPVASSLGFTGGQYNLGPRIGNEFEFAGILAGAPAVDLWGVNVYRGQSLDPLVLEWETLSGVTGFGGPMFLTEFGTDAWNQTLGRLEETGQADTAAILWDEVHRQLSANAAAAPMVGGVVYAWNDEWWKAGTPSAQDAGGFPLQAVYPDFQHGGLAATFLGHPDGFSNEEFYGLVTMSRSQKPVFAAMQEAFTLASLRIAPVDLGATSVGGSDASYVVFRKRGQPFALRYAGSSFPIGGRGINLAVISRSTSAVTMLRQFDTVTDAAGQCANLSTAVNAIRSGDVVLAAIGDSALASGRAMSAAVMAPCVQALQRLGAAQVLQIDYREPWALAAVAGTVPVNLAEQVGGAGVDTVTVSVPVELDVDRDGTPDRLDADNDNDGLSDLSERWLGTDILGGVN